MTNLQKANTSQRSSYTLKKKSKWKKYAVYSWVTITDRQAFKTADPSFKNEKARTAVFPLRAVYYIRAWNKHNGTRDGKAS